jgi:hypothetical protein
MHRTAPGSDFKLDCWLARNLWLLEDTSGIRAWQLRWGILEQRGCPGRVLTLGDVNTIVSEPFRCRRASHSSSRSSDPFRNKSPGNIYIGCIVRVIPAVAPSRAVHGKASMLVRTRWPKEVHTISSTSSTDLISTD